MLLRSCQYWNIVTGSVTELSASLSAVREFMLPAGTMLVTQGACDALQSCSELKSTSMIVSSSENVIAAKLNFMRDAMSRSDITQMLDTIRLLSSSVNAEKSKVCSRRLLDMPGKEVLSSRAASRHFIGAAHVPANPPGSPAKSALVTSKTAPTFGGAQMREKVQATLDKVVAATQHSAARSQPSAAQAIIAAATTSVESRERCACPALTHATSRCIY